MPIKVKWLWIRTNILNFKSFLLDSIATNDKIILTHTVRSSINAFSLRRQILFALKR